MRAEKGENTLTIDLTVPTNTDALVTLPQGYSLLQCGDEVATELSLSDGTYRIVCTK